METIGERLKKIREEKNISLQDVKKNTKLSLDVLEAIEEDRLSNFSPSYVKGFLKIYCRFLEIDHKDYVSEYEKSLSLEKEETIPKELPKRVRLSFHLKLFPKFKRILLFILIILILIFSFVFGVSIIKRRPITKSQDLKKDISEKKLEILRIALKAKDNCWLKVCVDGKIVYQGILKKGRQESWEAEDKIELNVGNAAALILEVGGKILSPLGRKGQVIKALITREGVSIK